MLEQQEQQHNRGTNKPIRFLSRISRGGGKVLITVPLDMHEKVKPLGNKPISVTIKEIVLD